MRSATPSAISLLTMRPAGNTPRVKNPELVGPDGALRSQFLLDRPGNNEIQLDLFLSYGSNPPLYPAVPITNPDNSQTNFRSACLRVAKFRLLLACDCAELFEDNTLGRGNPVSGEDGLDSVFDFL